jgi:crotonobetainyl-CoA:carnitine CoA-transferase CaiB-like acyl-CoA transferase
MSGDMLESIPANGDPMNAPLADLRILAVEQFGAGPWGTAQLADLGADVIKVEDPTVGGDVARYVPPFQSGEHSLYFEAFNRNKRSIALDLKNPQSRSVLGDVVRHVDVVFSNLRGDQPERLGLRYHQLAEFNPRIVCCSLSGFGMTGPRAAEGAYDHTIQGLAGWQSLTGEPDGPPVKSALSLVDFSAGYVAAVAMLAAVWRARRDGVGADVDLSLFETALSELTYLGTWVASRGFAPTRLPSSSHQSLVPFQNFPSADGWMVVACPKESLWVKLCQAVGRPELSHDPRFVDFTGRRLNRDELVPILNAVFRTRPTDEWVATLSRAGVPCSPIHDVSEALADPQVVARKGVVEMSHPVLGDVRQVASPFRISGFTPEVVRGPFLGEHTREVLTELCGYTPAQVNALADDGVFGASRGEAESRESESQHAAAQVATE